MLNIRKIEAMQNIYVTFLAGRAGRSSVGRRNLAQVVAVVGGRSRSGTPASRRRRQRRRITGRKRRGTENRLGS